MKTVADPSVRLYAILAREAPLAVIFRRGPSRRVLLVKWRTDTDEFAEGQWFKGRIYERRCDLSPSGKRLIYFAASYKKPLYSWTAVSRPPFLTAISLWPKGDAWGGGGLFEKEASILLNHRKKEMKLADGFTQPKGLKVNPLGEYAGYGEDNPIAALRMIRDGWKFIQKGVSVTHKSGSPIWTEYNPPIIWSRLNPRTNRKYELRQATMGLNKVNGPWYINDYTVNDESRGAVIALGTLDWADWCQSGDLLFTKEGQIFRLGFNEDGELLPPEKAKLLIDFSDRTFVAKESPPEAKRWGGQIKLEWIASQR